MGVNCQAMCDHLCWFTYFGTVSPGGANDVRAYRSSLIKEWVDNLPPPRYYIIADNAYIVSEHLLTPFYGAEKGDNHKDAFNFYLSPLCIRIEMAFGLLVTKWRILLHAPLQFWLKNVGKVLHCLRLAPQLLH